METSQPLSIESFSYSWLVNLKPSFESADDSLRASLDASDEASFIEMDPKLPASKRFFRDELISNGFLMPLFIKPLKIEAYAAPDSSPTTPVSSSATTNAHLASKIRCSSLRRCRRLSKQVFQKYLEFIRPLCQKLRGRRSGSRTDDAGTRMQEVNNWIYSPAISPRTSVGYSVDYWRRSCDSESSIYEAVLHCKRSIGTPNSFRFSP
ncbi:probable membrane-associated kinase regulator 6 isoform X2 [Diospyros lotus]|uniref:probable membrane-associated kinase regulator 6 isoform X2 n=1 Tax=Diospyros lotus TaxID=55363 RepID=UPI0022578054|nr:probable membrane-associated kinase regulator 6 isoform X2 [Diospyros lotus]